MSARDRAVVAAEKANDANEKSIKDEINTVKRILANLKIMLNNHYNLSSDNDKVADAARTVTLKSNLHDLVDEIITPGG